MKTLLRLIVVRAGPLLRLHQGSVSRTPSKALLRLHEGSMKALLRLIEGSVMAHCCASRTPIKALLRLY
jgi:hypothetical protein